MNEHSPLLSISHSFDSEKTTKLKGLSIFFGTVCLVDIFGVFPIVALPKAVLLCGWFGIPLVILIFFIQMYTAILLGKCWILAEYLDKTIVAKNRYPYAALAELAFGKNISILVTILLDVTIFGGGIPNIIVAAQNLQLFGLKMTENNFDLSYCYWMLIIGIVLCPFLWLGSPKDMKALCFLSVIVVFSISFMIWICIYNDDSIQHIPTDLLTKEEILRNIVTAYGILTFQFDIHPLLLTIQMDLIDKSKITYIIFLGFLVTTLLFALTTIFAGLKYGLNTYSNILQGLPPSFLLYLTVLLVTMQLCLTCAIGNSALYQHIEDYFNISRDFNYKRCLIRSLLTAFAVFVAESVPRFDLVMSMIGGTLTGPLVFIFPPLFYIKLLSLKRQHLSNISLQTANHIMYHCELNKCSEECFIENEIKYAKSVTVSDIFFTNVKCDWFFFKLTAACLVICFGFFATCTTTYLNFKDVFEYATFSPPCLFNATN